MRLKLGLFVLAAGIVAGSWSYYGTPAPSREPEASRRQPVRAIEAVAPDLYLIPGGGCNTLAYVMKDGVVLVDTKYREHWDELIGQLRTVTDKPITHVINSHMHPDHAEGNTQIAAGVKVVAHRSAIGNFRAKASGHAQPGSWTGTAPIEVDDRLTLFDGGDAVDLYYFGPAHTGGDLLVVFRRARVMHAGDVMIGLTTPMSVLGSGGSGATFADVVERAVREIGGVDRVVTGHGPVVPWSEFVNYGELNRLMFNHVKANMHMGADKWKVFKSFKAPEKFNGYDFSRATLAMDEMDASIRPRWQRLW